MKIPSICLFGAEILSKRIGQIVKPGEGNLRYDQHACWLLANRFIAMSKQLRARILNRTIKAFDRL